MLSTHMSSLAAQLPRLLHPPLDWKCRTLRSTFFIWVHITMSIDSVEKSISSRCYSNSHSLLAYMRNRYYATTPKALSNKFCKHVFIGLRNTVVANQSIPNKDKNLQTTFDITYSYDIILMCVLGSKCFVIYALTNNEQF